MVGGKAAGAGVSTVEIGGGLSVCGSSSQTEDF